MLTYPNGDTRDVTNEVRFLVDSGYGSFNANTLTMNAAGKTQVPVEAGEYEVRLTADGKTVTRKLRVTGP